MNIKSVNRGSWAKRHAWSVLNAISISTAIFAATGCSKKPKACIDGPTQSTVFVTNTYTSCSENAEGLNWEVEWNFEPDNGQHRLDEASGEKYERAWSIPGQYEIRLSAESKKGDEDETTLVVEILDRCFHCEKLEGSQVSEITVCAGDQAFYEEVNYLSWMQMYMDQGYSCSEE